MYDTSREQEGVPVSEDGPFSKVREALVDAGADPADWAGLELASVAAWCAAHGLAEMMGFPQFEKLKEALGGEDAFLRGVFEHMGIFAKGLRSKAPVIDRDVPTPFVTRFAPSPTGLLHKGHAFSALTAYAAAQEVQGRFLLRIEDIDTGRCRPEYEAAILEDLAWLGLTWETPVRRQSEHLADYAAALDRLRDQGLLYRCFRTRREIGEAIASAPHGAMEAWRGEPLPPDEERERLRPANPTPGACRWTPRRALWAASTT